MRLQLIVIAILSLLLLTHATAIAQAPAPPLYGRQVVVHISSNVLCAKPVLGAVKGWAEFRGMIIVENSHTPASIDVEVRPTNMSFEQQCMLFSVKFRDNSTMKQQFSQLLNDVGNDPTKITSIKMRQLGFAAEDIDHMREHARHFMDTYNRAHPVRYYRITYSLTPTKEYTVNMGTVEEESSEEHDKEFEELNSLIQIAAYCYQEP